MTPHYDQLAEIVAAAEEITGDARERYLNEACPPEWRPEVDSLLRAGDDGRDVFEKKASALGEILTAFRGEQLAGQTVGPYLLEAMLGAGGMGVVYRGRHRHTGELAAVKVIPTQSGDAAWQARFEREARSLQSMRHENVVRLIDSGEDDVYRYLAMELVPGQSLRESNPRDWRAAVAIGRQIAAALSTVHAAGVIHRDLKPENVMLTGQGRAVLIDFGLARKDERLDASVAGISGTFGYFSPEQVRGEPATDRADIFALGAMLYELATGQRAFQGSSPLTTAAAILSGKLPALPGVVPAALAQLIRRCLKQHPEQRPAAREVETELARLAATTQPPTLRRQRWTRRASAAAASIALAFAGWTAWLDTAPAPLFRQAIPTPGMQVFEPALAWHGGWLAFTAPAAGGTRQAWITPASTWQPKQVTFEASGVSEPSLSPDGRHLAFRSLRDPAGIHVRDLTNNHERLLAPGGHSPRYSPDGRSIAYWTGKQNTADPIRADSAQTFIISAHGGRPQPVAPNLGNVHHPVWAPDSQRLAFTSPGALCVWDRRTHNVLRLPSSSNKAMAWRSAFGREEILSLADGHVMTTALATRTETPLTPAGERAQHLTLDRSGRIVLASETTSEGLWSLTLHQPGAPPTPLLRGGGNYALPLLSRDGRHISYQAGDTNRLERRDLISGQVTIAPPDTMFTTDGRVIDVARTHGAVWDLSPDGETWLSACHSTHGTRAICLQQHGRARVLLQHPRLHLYLAGFSPDRSRVVFTGEADHTPPQLFLSPATGALPGQWQSLGPGDYPRFAPDGSLVFLHKTANGHPALYRMAIGHAPVLLYEFTESSPSPRLVRPGFFRLAAARDRIVFPLGEREGRLYQGEQISSIHVSPFSPASPVNEGGVSLLSKINLFSRSAMLSTLTILGLTAPAKAAPVSLQNATATFSQTSPGSFLVNQAIDGVFGSFNGWAINGPGGVTSAQTAVFETASNIGSAGGTVLTFNMSFEHTDGHLLGRFRLSVTTDDRSLFADGLASGGDVAANWVILTPQSAVGTNGATLAIQGDNSILGTGTAPLLSLYTITALTNLTGITGFRLETLADPSLPTNGPGRQLVNGNFVVTEFQVDATAAGVPEPGSALLLLAPLAGGWLWHRRRQRA